jgi:hypothetical protein
MNEMTKLAPSVGADALAIMLAPSLGQRDGIRMSSVRFSGTAGNGGNAGFGRTTGYQGGTTVLAAKRIPTAVRVRVPADIHVPGAPPRGAPV